MSSSSPSSHHRPTDYPETTIAIPNHENQYNNNNNETSIINNIVNKQWDKIRTVLKTQPATAQHHLVESTDNRGWNAIHQACYDNTVPSDIFRSLVSISQKALLTKNNGGWTPLHYAIMYMSMSSSENDGLVLLLKACPEAASLPSKKGWTPLHVAIHYESKVEIIQELLVAYPLAVRRKNQNDDTPLDIFVRKWNRGLRTLLDERSLGDESSIIDLDLKREDDFGSIHWKPIRDIYDTIILLLPPAMASGNQIPSTVTTLVSSTFRLLRSSIMCSHCSYAFCSILLRIHPKQAFQSDDDERSLLTVALEEFSTTSSYDGMLYECNRCRIQLNDCSWYHHKRNYFSTIKCQSCWAFQEEEEGMMDDYILVPSVNKIPRIIQELIAIHPQSASFPTSKKDGRLPLHHLVLSNQQLTQQQFDIIRTVFHAAPEALSTRDMQSHMYPFLLAAVVRRPGKKDEAILEMLTLVFELLMENPVLVGFAI